MHTVPLKTRLRWLRALIGALLTLHVGLGQASTVHGGVLHAGVKSAQVASQSIAFTARCHGEVVTSGVAAVDRSSPAGASSPAASGHSVPHAPCCETHDCHCAAACYQSVATLLVLIGITNHTVPSSLNARATLPPQLARELRPPIAL